jgi:hypothetical protein
MPTNDYYHANNTLYTDLPEADYVPKIHCAKHGMQSLWDGECIRCYDEWMEKLNEAWPRGCPSGYGENAT